MEYCEAATRALQNFQHPVVFCANTRGGACVRLTPLLGEQQLPQQAREQQQGQQQEGQQAWPQQGQQGGGGPPGGEAPGGDELAHLGAEMPDDVARGVAYGGCAPQGVWVLPSSSWMDL